jgi:hypothetical protein
MRLIIATLVALVASASALPPYPPRRGDIRLPPSRHVTNRDLPITAEQLKDLGAKLGDKAKEILQNLEVACEAYVHAKGAGQLKHRAVLDARAPTITEQQAKTWEEKVSTVVQSVEKVCEAYVHFKEAGPPPVPAGDLPAGRRKLHRRQATFGDEARLEARGFSINAEKLKKLGEKAKQIIASAEAAYDTYNKNQARDLDRIQQRGIFGDEDRLVARSRKIADADVKKLGSGSRTVAILKAIKDGKITTVEELEQLLLAWNYQNHLND